MHGQEIEIPKVPFGSYIGLLGGSFDPPHLSHQLLALSFLALETIVELWITPCAQHAFKGELTPFHHRLAMCEKAFQRIRDVRVLPIESQLKTPTFTIETIKAIHKKRPDLKILLCLGSDLVSNFDRWKDAQEIAQLVDLALFERKDFLVTTLPPILQNARVHRGYALPPIASTHLRDSLGRGDRKAMSALIDRDVLRYIEKNRLYEKNKIS